MFKNSTHNLKGVSYYEITFHGSAAIEKKGFTGITHIIEHCMCEKVKELEPIFKEKAIEWNAVTSDNYMRFYICGMTDVVNEYRDIFTDKILNYKIEKEVFERERNIIVAEYYQVFSDQYESFISNFFRKYYNYAGAIGLIEDIKNLKYEDFIKYKNEHYSKPVYIGYIHPKKEQNLSFENVSSKIEFKDIEEYPKFNEFKNYNEYPIEKCSKFESQRVLLGLYTGKLSKSCKELVYFSYLNSILCGGLTSPLYQELREKLQGVYSICPFTQVLDRNNFISGIYVAVNAEKKTEVMNKFQEMMKNITDYISEKDFNISVKQKMNAEKLKKLTSFRNRACFSEIGTKISNIIVKGKISYEEFLNYVKKLNDYNFFDDENSI